MRVGSYGIYDQFVLNQADSLKELLKVNNQISSGKKIQYGYEDSNVYVDSLRLDAENKTLKQVSDTTKKATKQDKNKTDSR